MSIYDFSSVRLWIYAESVAKDRYEGTLFRFVRGDHGTHLLICTASPSLQILAEF